MHEVLGMMLVDPLHEDLLHRVGSPHRGFLLWGHGIISPLGLYRIPGALFYGRTREDRVYGVSAYQSGKLIKARLQENLVADSLTKNDISSARAIMDKKTPLVVITSGIEARTDQDWERKQEDLTGISKNLVEWTVVNKAPHEVWKTYEGRVAMEKGLKNLMAAVKPK
jgi:DNA-binding transcriptional regulator YiaG